MGSGAGAARARRATHKLGYNHQHKAVSSGAPLKHDDVHRAEHTNEYDNQSRPVNSTNAATACLGQQKACCNWVMGRPGHGARSPTELGGKLDDREPTKLQLTPGPNFANKRAGSGGSERCETVQEDTPPTVTSGSKWGGGGRTNPGTTS